jgi:hypothetical protein
MLLSLDEKKRTGFLVVAKDTTSFDAANEPRIDDNT